MRTINNIDHIIAGIVTKIALAFPVTYILSISFFHRRKKIAVCTWENSKFPGGFNFYKVGDNNELITPIAANFQTVVVNAIDSNGSYIKLHHSFK